MSTNPSGNRATPGSGRPSFLDLRCLTSAAIILGNVSWIAGNKPPTSSEGRIARFRPAPASPLEVGITAGMPATADLNGDARMDIVLPCARPDALETGRLCIYLGDDDGGFERSSVALPLPGRALRFDLGDIDGDGKVDAIVSQHDTYDVAILLGDGRGGFRPAAEPTVSVHDGTSPHTHAVALADVNGDSHLDVLATCADDNALAVLLGNGNGVFNPAPDSPFAAGRHPYEAISVGDVNGDGNPDVAVPNLHGRAASLLLGDGKGRFEHTPDSPIQVGVRPGYVTLGHLNGDAALDMVVTHDGEPIVAVLLGDGQGRLKPAAFSPIRLEQRVWTASIVDLDADGHNDIVLGGVVDNVFVIFGAGQAGVRLPPQSIADGDKSSGYLTLSDLNGDGKLDLVVAHFNGSMLDVYVGE